MATPIRPVEETMKLSDTKQQFSRVINRVARGEANIIVEKSGLPVAALVSIDEYRQRKEAGEEAEEEVQGETLYRLVEQGVISSDDLDDEEQLDIAVYLVNRTRWEAIARRRAEAKIVTRRQQGESPTDRDFRDEIVKAARDIRLEYLEKIGRRQ